MLAQSSSIVVGVKRLNFNVTSPPVVDTQNQVNVPENNWFTKYTARTRIPCAPIVDECKCFVDFYRKTRKLIILRRF